MGRRDGGVTTIFFLNREVRKTWRRTKKTDKEIRDEEINGRAKKENKKARGQRERNV